MGLFSKKESNEVVFGKMSGQKGFKLENQNGAVKSFKDVDIEDYLQDMFNFPEQFVTLTVPELQHQIRFVQACLQGDKVEVELGIEKEDGTHLVYKLCEEEECRRIFLGFFNNEFIPDMEEYQPVQF